MKKININIDVSFGSDFQEQVFISALTTMLSALSLHFKSSHKKNKIEHIIIANYPMKKEYLEKIYESCK